MKIGMMSFAHHHAESYIQNLRAIPDVEVMGIADDDTERGKHFAEMFNTRWFESYEALLAEKPDGVVVCSENARHRPLVEMAAQAGAHVLCEKPLATTVEDAQVMVDMCEKAGVILMVAFPMRFSPVIGEINRMMRAGGLGQIFAVNGTNQGECPKHLRAWFVDKNLAGGGAITDHIVHIADLLRWMLDSEVMEVFAEANHILYADETDLETGGLVSLTFANGTIATIDCSWSKPRYYPTWGGLSLELIGEKGVVKVNAFKQVLTVYTHARQRPHYAYWGSDANQAMIGEFVAAIREDRAPAITGYNGYKVVEIVAAAYRSVEMGEVVRLNV